MPRVASGGNQHFIEFGGDEMPRGSSRPTCPEHQITVGKRIAYNSKRTVSRR